MIAIICLLAGIGLGAFFNDRARKFELDVLEERLEVQREKTAALTRLLFPKEAGHGCR